MIPIRCCIACKTRKNKEDFIRIVADKEKNAIIDINQNINSRGIYICKDKKCINNLQKAILKNRVNLKINVDLDSILGVLKELGEEIWEN
ncbi:MAG: YlxR family protein [Clostridia bacterium]